MPSKYNLRNFQQNGYYHVYNRGAHKQNIFHHPHDYITFTDILSYYLYYPNGAPLSYIAKLAHPENHSYVSQPQPTYQLLCYCLMPNHFHLMLCQLFPPETNNSISSLMLRLNSTYSSYHNRKYNHSGTLYQGKYKNVHIVSDEQKIYVSKYIHRNPGQGVFESYPYSSYADYLEPESARRWLHPKPVLDHFTTNHPQLSYQTFVDEPSAPSLLTAQQLLDL